MNTNRQDRQFWSRRSSSLAVVAAFAKRSDVYLLTLCCVYLMATFGLNLTVGYAGPDVARPGGVLRHRRVPSRRSC